MSSTFWDHGNRVLPYGIYTLAHYYQIQYTMLGSPYSRIKISRPFQVEPYLLGLSIVGFSPLSLLPFFHNLLLIYIRFSFVRVFRSFKCPFSRCLLCLIWKINPVLWGPLLRLCVFPLHMSVVFGIHPNPRIFCCNNPSLFLNHGK